MSHPGVEPAPFRQVLVDVHGNYRAGRITHEPPDELITDTVTARTMRPHLTRATFFFLLLAATTLGWFVTTLIATLDSPFGGEPSGFGQLIGGLSSLLGFGIFLTVVVFVISLFRPLREPIAEYGVLIEGRARAGEFVFDWIAYTAHARQSPFVLELARVRGVPVLLAANERVRGLVSVRKVGTDLFLGWHLWRNRSTATLLLHLVRDMFGASQSRAPVEIVNAGWAAALRELLHSVTREGAQAALLDAAPAGHQTTVRVEQLEELGDTTPTGPQYRGAPPPPPPAGPGPATGERYGSPPPDHGTAGPNGR